MQLRIPSSKMEAVGRPGNPRSGGGFRKASAYPSFGQTLP